MFKSLKQVSKLHLVPGIIITIYFLPYIILGENANILIHDNLDSNIAWVKILLDNNLAFANPNITVHQIFDGLKLANLYAYSDLSLFIFKIFGIYDGYVINKVIMCLVAYFGMFFLLKNYYKTHNKNDFIIISVSLLFSLLPFWSFQISVSGIPLVFYAFINILKRDYRIKNWIIIVFYGSYSSLVLTGIFIFFILGSILVYDFYKNKRINIKFILASILLGCVYLISHYPVISNFLVCNDVVMHRNEFYKSSIGLLEALNNSFRIFAEGQNHAHSRHMIFLIFFIIFVSRIKFDNTTKLLISFLVLTSLFYGLKDYHYFQPIVKKFTEKIPLQLQRFHTLHPFVWYLLLAIVLQRFNLTCKKDKIIVYTILIIQFIFLVTQHELIYNINKPTYAQFYDKELFDKVKSTINEPVEQYKIANVGLHPAITQFNGFYTVDGYVTNYPLKYKNKFRNVIEDEINRDEGIKSYFDNWGSRCYAFSSELKRKFLNNNHKEIEYLLFDYSALKNLGCKYIISTTSINTTNNTELSYISKLTGEYWNIYIYKIISD